MAAALAIGGCGGGSHGSRSRSLEKYGTEIKGSLPAVGTPMRGGTITVGQLHGNTPGSAFPLIDIATCNTATLNFVENRYIPLYAGPNGAEPKIDESLSAAELPQYSNADRTVTIKLKRGLKWSDGKPVDAEDVLFYLDLLRAAIKQAPRNWCQYSPGDLPDNIASWTASGADTVILHLTHAVNPSWFTANQLQGAGGGVYRLPSQETGTSMPPVARTSPTGPPTRPMRSRSTTICTIRAVTSDVRLKATVEGRRRAVRVEGLQRHRRFL